MTRRVLTVIDVETTGFEPPAEVIELGWQDVIIEDGEASLGGYGSRLFGAERGIPPETMAVHHIREAEIAGRPLFGTFDLEELLHGESGAANDGAPPDALVAHNAAFEGLWFTPTVIGNMPLICTLKAASRVWGDAPGHSNGVLRYWLGLDLIESRAMPPHRAGPDAYVTANILIRLLDHATVEEMTAWTAEPRVMRVCPIGQEWRGKPWEAVDVGFLRWVCGKSDIAADIRWNAQREVDRRRGAKAA
jgi:exodeoxyribonuclease X